MLPNRSPLEAMKMLSAQELKVFIIPGRVAIKMGKKVIKFLTRKVFTARKCRALSRGHGCLERRKAGIIPGPS